MRKHANDQAYQKPVVAVHSAFWRPMALPNSIKNSAGRDTHLVLAIFLLANPAFVRDNLQVFIRLPNTLLSAWDRAITMLIPSAEGNLMHALKRKNWFAVVLVVVCLAPLACAQHVGRVTGLIPNATGNSKPLKQNEVVTQGEDIATDKTGRLRITLDDGSKLTLGSSSHMKLTQHDSASRVTHLDLAGGRLRSEVASFTQSTQKYEVRTAIAVAGVIGTDFEVVVNPDGSVTVYCFSGAVSVTTPAGATVNLSPGQSVTVTGTQLGTVQNFDPNNYTDETFSPFPLPIVAGGGGLSGGQIAGITIGVIGGAITGVLATTGGSPSATPSATPCQLPTIATAARAKFGNCILVNRANPAAVNLQQRTPTANSLLAQHYTNLLQGHQFVAPNPLATHNAFSFRSNPATGYAGRNWFAANTPQGVHSHLSATWVPQFLAKKPAIGNATGFAVRHWTPAGANHTPPQVHQFTTKPPRH